MFDIAFLTMKVVPRILLGLRTVALLAALSVAPVELVGQASPTAESAVARWSAGDPNSKEFLLTGRKVQVLIADPVAAFVFLDLTDDPLQLYVHFVNRGNEPFDVLPENFTLSAVYPKQKALEYVSPQQIAKKIDEAAALAMIGEALSSVGRTIGGTSTTTYSGIATASSSSGASALGIYNGVRTTHDSTANQQVTAANLAAISTASEAEKLRKLTGAVLANTVFPGQDFGGTVHFRKEKKAALLVLRMPIAGRILEFPIEMPKR